MSGRDRERERDRRAQQASARTNEYFVPKDGIDREVITADICRYLGNDALVRPGNYENPQTRQIQQGYFITAYRNLTTAMIADLKADSERWEAERRATASRGQPSNGISFRDSDGIVRKSNTPIVEYRASTTHQSRQYYGPTSETAAAVSSSYPSASTPSGQVYDNSVQGGYAQPNYAQPSSGYQQQTPAYVQNTPSDAYHYGANMLVDARDPTPRMGVQPVTSQSLAPRSNVQYATSGTSYQQPDSRSTYYSSGQQAGVPVSSAQYATQPADPYYGRGAYNH
ncbi:hypothetical protein N431DRAFT_98608 [Stipitochalara longipes BDJ]|nr:hypothetical protein N431DRAFT_98608 [Stipitochalara longipes BDJ]